MRFTAVILAAGQGSRMNSDLPKVMHKLAGVPMLDHVIQCATLADAEQIITVVGHGAELVEKHIKPYEDIKTVMQSAQNGTGHAVLQTADMFKEYEGDILVLYGDTPFVSPDTIEKMIQARSNGNQIVVLGFNAADPTGYGRLIMQGEQLSRIVEEKDCNETDRAVSFCNSGVICGPAQLVLELLKNVGTDNANAEIYLTDIIGLAQAAGHRCAAVLTDESETLGVNTRADLAAAEQIFQTRKRLEMLENGVTMVAADTVFFAFDTVIGRDVTIEPNVFFGPDVSIENHVVIKGFSHLEGCHIAQNAQIGPFARLRPGAEIGADARVGNFVEIKASVLGNGAKVGHLSYIGDGEIGENTNIGAGVIFCNYDGVFKHKSTVGRDAFIGSNSALVSPVVIGDGGFVATGSVITNDVPTGDLAIARAEQVNKTGLGTRLMAALKAKIK